MREILIALFTSKKFVASLGTAMAAIAVRVAAEMHIGIDADLARELAGYIIWSGAAYVGGQGIADMRKPAAEKPTEPPKP